MKCLAFFADWKENLTVNDIVTQAKRLEVSFDSIFFYEVDAGGDYSTWLFSTDVLENPQEFYKLHHEELDCGNVATYIKL